MKASLREEPEEKNEDADLPGTKHRDARIAKGRRYRTSSNAQHRPARLPDEACHAPSWKNETQTAGETPALQEPLLGLHDVDAVPIGFGCIFQEFE